MATERDTLPSAITLADGITMTFLKDSDWVMRVQIVASQLNSTADDIAFSVPPHWHDTHDEIHHVIKGRMEVTLGPETKIYTPEDGEIFIPRGVVHSIRAFKEDAIIEERTQPMDGEKEIFFRNLLADGTPPFMQAMLVAYQLDMYPGFPGHIKWLEKGFTILFGGILAPLLGYKLKYPLSLKKQN